MIEDDFDISQELESIEKRIRELDNEKSELLAKKVQLQSNENLGASESNDTSAISQLSKKEKVKLFQSLFLGRADIYANRWENAAGKSGYAIACYNEWKSGLCQKPKIKCGDCPNKAFKPLDEQAIFEHLTGRQVIGLYPLTQENTCYLLAIDFDKSDWQPAIQAFSTACDKFKIPHAIERSRSGNGGHVWIFFEREVPARDARRLGNILLDQAMEQYAGLTFDSYDRFFPNQDFMPSGGFGNLIALPLQFKSRQYGNSVFVSKSLVVLEDQWLFLKKLKKCSVSDLQKILSKFESIDAANDIMPWEHSLPVPKTLIKNCPKRVEIVLANQLYIPSSMLPSALLARLKRLASFANPVFFKTQAMRFSTQGIPRFVTLARIEQNYLVLPRGCLDKVKELFSEQKIEIDFKDERVKGTKLTGIQFAGQLRSDQKFAVRKITDEDIGALHAPTAFGKTVTAIGVIAQRKVATLVLTHTRQLVDQWKERLIAFLPNVDIGIICGGKNSPSGSIDIATYQSLINRKDNSVNELVHNYGQIIIDECHHIAAPNYDRLLSEIRARYFLGLTATPERQDGHQPIIFMQAGPVRYRVKEDKNKPFEQEVHIKHITTPLTEGLLGDYDKPHIAEVYRWLSESDQRNQLIVKDTVTRIEDGFNPLVLTERREHAELLNQMITEQGKTTTVLKGAMRAKERDAALNKLKNADVLIATGKYIGEGFDLPKLDALILALPISWKGTLAQYAGRLHRELAGKQRVVVNDYVDDTLPMLQRMYRKRCKGYEAMGYRIFENDNDP